MPKKEMKKQIFCSLFSATLLCSSTLTAAVVEKENVETDCSRDILLAYFPEVFVKETLKKFNVPEDKWSEISKDLAIKDKDIIKQVEAKAAAMTPNPLKDPQQRQAAVKIFRDTLLENFTSVLQKYGVSDEKQIQSMLEDIQQQKARRFAKCMEAQRANSADKKPDVSNAKDDDDLEDADDDHDSEPDQEDDED